MSIVSRARTWCVYAISSPSTKKSYVGATTNHLRRLRQHNSEIKGGAKYTRGATDWRYIFRVDGFVDTQALQFEWSLKHPSPAAAVAKSSVDAVESVVSSKKKPEPQSRKRKRRRPRRASGRGVTGRVSNLERVLLLENWRDLPLVVTWCGVEVERPSTFSPPPWISEQNEACVSDAALTTESTA
jgi:predicted GIY-YIG superfamily endonuclease